MYNTDLYDKTYYIYYKIDFILKNSHKNLVIIWVMGLTEATHELL